MRTSPFNKKVHDVLTSKGFSYKERGHVDVYSKNGTTIFIYMSDHCFMITNGKVATQKEFEDATQLSR
jgi:hypothetical protein